MKVPTPRQATTPKRVGAKRRSKPYEEDPDVPAVLPDHVDVPGPGRHDRPGLPRHHGADRPAEPDGPLHRLHWRAQRQRRGRHRQSERRPQRQHPGQRDHQ